MIITSTQQLCMEISRIAFYRNRALNMGDTMGWKENVGYGVSKKSHKWRLWYSQQGTLSV